MTILKKGDIVRDRHGMVGRTVESGPDETGKYTVSWIEVGEKKTQLVDSNDLLAFDEKN